MRVCAVLLAASLVAGLMAQEPTVHPKYGPKVSVMARDNGYLRRAGAAPDFWSLIPFYVPQFNDYSCSAAAVAMVVNGFLHPVGRILADTERNVTQADLLARVREIPWQALVSPVGEHGQHGLKLAELAMATKCSLDQYGLADGCVEIVEFTAGELARLRQALARNEVDAHDYLLAHFVQDELTGARGGPYPHVSPIAAYDAATDRVLILDVDREWYEPYWVGVEDLLGALTRSTETCGQGGLVWVESGGGGRSGAVAPPGSMVDTGTPAGQ